MIHVLIVDEDAAFAERLSKALSQLTRSYDPTYVKTAVEARMLLAGQPQDLAFVAPDPQGEVMNALRAVQPDLRLVLTAPTLDFDLPDVYAGHVQGVLIRPLLAFDLEGVMQQALAQPVTPTTSLKTRQRQSNGHGADSPAVIEALQKADLGELVKTAVFTRGARLIGYWGRLTDAEATAVAQHIGHNWSERNHRIQIQFLHLPAHSGDLLLYTRYIIDRFMLTLVSLPNTPINELRRRADQLADILRDTLAGESVSLAQPPLQEDQRATYAVVWRPVNSLPTALHIPLRRIIERLAAANGCVLTYSKVQSQLIHLVVNCPPKQKSSWIVVLFKNGTEEAIQQEYGLTVSLWEPGYYAEERTEPLAETELRVFLERKAVASSQ
jgi:CheY-like chemotaxis protein